MTRLQEEMERLQSENAQLAHTLKGRDVRLHEAEERFKHAQMQLDEAQRGLNPTNTRIM